MNQLSNAPRSFPGASLLRDPLVLLIITIGVIGMATSPYYFTAANLDNLMRSISIIGLLSLGVTVVILTGRIDLSCAAVMVFSVILAVVAIDTLGGWLGQRWMVRGNSFVGPAGAMIAVTILSGLVAGILNGIGVAWLKVSSFIMTLVMLTALRGLSYVLTNGHPYYLQSPAISWIGESTLAGIPFSFIIFLLALLGLMWFLGRTTVGRRLYAIGGNEKAAAYAGIKTSRYVVLAFAISGAYAALAGVLFTARLKSVDAPLAAGYELTAIAIAVIGGTVLSGGIGSPWRTLLGSLAFAGGLNLLAIWGVGSWYQNLAVGIALLIAVGLSPASRIKAWL